MTQKPSSSPKKQVRGSGLPRVLLLALLALGAVVTYRLWNTGGATGVSADDLPEAATYMVRCPACDSEYEMEARQYAQLVETHGSDSGIPCAKCGTARAWREPSGEIPEQAPDESEADYARRVWGLAGSTKPLPDTDFGRRVLSGEFDRHGSKPD